FQIVTCLLSTVLITFTVKMFNRIPNQSQRAQINIKRATTTLFIQFGIFILLLLIPVVLIASQALAVFHLLGPYPFLVAVTCFFSHGLFISIVSIVMSKDHRSTIASFLCTKKRQVKVVT
ncbi:hypothetical protein PMAYCL1PPCAC_21011, partial [Pristionchus mayeri]